LRKLMLGLAERWRAGRLEEGCGAELLARGRAAACEAAQAREGAGGAHSLLQTACVLRRCSSRASRRATGSSIDFSMTKLQEGGAGQRVRRAFVRRGYDEARCTALLAYRANSMMKLMETTRGEG